MFATDTPTADGSPATTLQVKVVPGASRTEVAGLLGDRLKVRVAAAPEHGEANDAVCRLLAKALSLPARSVSIATGHARPTKSVLARGIGAAEASRRLGV